MHQFQGLVMKVFGWFSFWVISVQGLKLVTTKVWKIVAPRLEVGGMRGGRVRWQGFGRFKEWKI